VYVLDADMYEESIGIKHDRRFWHRCDACGIYFQDNSLSDKDLKKIYDVYRNVSMRGKTVKEEFDRIVGLPYSENKDRINRLIEDGFEGGTLLDIGSGLGVFPYEIQPYMKEVCCIEPNKDSCDFINTLNMECHQGYYKPNVFKKKFDYISVIHVLEHQRDPIAFLSKVATDLNDDGIVYIEIPDAIEFEYLDRNHDEFNSTHLWMFDVSVLDRICIKARLLPIITRRIKYGERKLSRIATLARRI
jgi:SAM-dependent methyltransferase